MVVGSNWCGMNVCGLGDNFGNGLSDGNLLNWLWDLDIGWLTVDHGVESVVIVSSVLNGTLVSIRIDQTVLAMNLIAVAGFMLILDVTGVLIVHSVGEFVLSVVIIVVKFNLLYEGWLGNSFDQSWLGNVSWLSNCFQQGRLLLVISDLSWFMVGGVQLLDWNYSCTSDG